MYKYIQYIYIYIYMHVYICMYMHCIYEVYLKPRAEGAPKTPDSGGANTKRAAHSATVKRLHRPLIILDVHVWLWQVSNPHLAFRPLLHRSGVIWWQASRLDGRVSRWAFSLDRRWLSEWDVFDIDNPRHDWFYRCPVLYKILDVPECKK